jgi:Secretion system C-terminal sorting domain
MKHFLFILLFLPQYIVCTAQVNKSGNTVIFGVECSVGVFSADTNRPATARVFPIIQGTDRLFTSGHSCISDSASGKLKVICNGYRLFDSIGNIMENGDSLVPAKIYIHNSIPNAPTTQGSIILPKGSNGLYYVFVATTTDSAYTYWVANGGEAPYNIVQYHVVDMNANGGLGKVIEKNKKLVQFSRLNKVGMMACRHANGYDWWLLKQAGYDSNMVYRFLVKADTVEGPYLQTFSNISFGKFDNAGQSAFSTDGKKYVYITGGKNKVFMADFNRCTGLLSNPTQIPVPIDSTTYPFIDNQGVRDSLMFGICFSLNDSFIYLSKQYNVYQYDLNDTNSNTKWIRLQHGSDTSALWFEYYGQMYREPDGRIYIGKYGSNSNSCSVIDYPNKKGVACGFCRKCFRVDSSYSISAPANMPDFTLGADSSCYWPLASGKFLVVSGELKVYPNPANNIINIEGIFNQNDKLEIYTAIGQKVLEKNINPNCTKLQINIEALPRGLYVVKVKNGVVRFLKE